MTHAETHDELIHVAGLIPGWAAALKDRSRKRKKITKEMTKFGRQLAVKLGLADGDGSTCHKVKATS